ncbi:uncharacterized protein LOC117780928 [Drosophila innubila]|uniref:uncharacterized protein LOC117780928 n=1 Tax=Drosophila innubila TaxID=198719 RepID=UPI00148D8BD7|nr:uncharacterized protein LOC117780928 [Drosophila innubila]
MHRSQHEGVSNKDPKQLERKMEMELRYNLLMPIDPEYDPAMCRDEFLRKLFAELNLPQHEKFSTESSTDSSETGFNYPPRLSEKISLSTFVRKAPVVIKATRRMDRGQWKDYTASSYKFSVLSGRTDLHDELMESMKRSSLYLMFSRVLNRLRIMERISLDWGDIDRNTLPNMLFKWSMDAFFKRCMLPESTYLDVLQMNHSEESLEWAKFSTDIEEIIRYYKFFYTETFLDKGYKAMLTIVGHQQQLLNIGEELDQTLAISKKDFDRIAQRSRKDSSDWWRRHRRNLVKECKRRSMTATVLLPIQWRYMRDNYATMTEMQILKDNMAVDKLRNQIKEIRQQMEDDQQTTHQTMLIYNIQIENYQSRIDTFSEKLSSELSQWEDKNLIATIQLNKAVDEYKNIEDKIAFMERRVLEVQELKIAERQAQIDRIFNSNSQPTNYQSSKATKKKGLGKKLKRFR